MSDYRDETPEEREARYQAWRAEVARHAAARKAEREAAWAASARDPEGTDRRIYQLAAEAGLGTEPVSQGVDTVNENQSCFAQLLDIRFFIIAARQMMGRAGAGTCAVLICIFGLIGLILLPIYVSYDLASTWAWATPIQAAAQPAVSDITGAIEGYSAEPLLFEMSLGQIVAALMLVGITMLPSLFEIGFPSMRHPLLMLLLTGAILFDYVTDWSTSWAATAQWSGADNWLIHFLWTAFVFNPFVSIGVQALLVVCATVVLFGFVRLVSGAARPAVGEAVIIRQ